MEDVDRADGSIGSAVDVSCSGGGGTSDGLLSSTVDDGCSIGGTIGAVTSSIDGSGESSR